MSLAALVYVLASVALVVQVGAHRMLDGVWGVDGPSLLRLLVVTVAQAVALLLVRLGGRRRRKADGASVDGGDDSLRGSSSLGVFLALWLLLAVINTLLGVAFSAVVLGRLDLRFVAFLTLLVAPPAQAVVLLWVGNTWSFRGLGGRLKEGLRGGFARSIVAAATFVVVASWATADDSAMPIGDLRLLWAGAASLVAGIMLSVVAFRHPWPQSRRIALLSSAAWLVALGLDPLVPWIPALAALFPDGWPTVVVWAAVGGAMLVLTFVLLIAVSRTARTRYAAAGFFLDAAGGVAFAVAMVAVLSTFLRRYPTPLWYGVLSTGVTLAATSAAVGAVLLLRHGHGVGATR